jgi:hypothetical protein
MEETMRRILAALLILSFATPALAGPYLDELLEIKGYRTGFDTMLAGEKNLPAWLKTFAKTMDGTAMPSEDLKVGGQSYVYAEVCKPHDCGGNMLHVVFGFGGEQAWAILEEADGAKSTTRLLGHPDKALADALQAKVGN